MNQKTLIKFQADHSNLKKSDWKDNGWKVIFLPRFEGIRQILIVVPLFQLLMMMPNDAIPNEWKNNSKKYWRKNQLYSFQHDNDNFQPIPTICNKKETFKFMTKKMCFFPMLEWNKSHHTRTSNRWTLWHNYKYGCHIPHKLIHLWMHNFFRLDHECR